MRKQQSAATSSGAKLEGKVQDEREDEHGGDESPKETEEPKAPLKRFKLKPNQTDSNERDHGQKSQLLQSATACAGTTAERGTANST